MEQFNSLIGYIDVQSLKSVSFSKKSLRKHIMIVLHLFILALIQRFIDVTVSIFPYFNKFDRGKPMILPIKEHDRNSFFKVLNNIPSSSLGVNQHPPGSIKIDAHGNRMNFKSKKEKSLSMDNNIKFTGKYIQ